MGIQKWSDEITIVELGDDPLFTDELTSLARALEENPCSVILNFAAVGFINSSNIATLLRLRNWIMNNKCRLVLCGLNTQVWGIVLVTGLDKLFEFTKDISTALATLQLAEDDR